MFILFQIWNHTCVIYHQMLFHKQKCAAHISYILAFISADNFNLFTAGPLPTNQNFSISSTEICTLSSLRVLLTLYLYITVFLWDYTIAMHDHMTAFFFCTLIKNINIIHIYKFVVNVIMYRLLSRIRMLQTLKTRVGKWLQVPGRIFV